MWPDGEQALIRICGDCWREQTFSRQTLPFDKLFNDLEPFVILSPTWLFADARDVWRLCADGIAMSEAFTDRQSFINDPHLIHFFRRDFIVLSWNMAAGMEAGYPSLSRLSQLYVFSTYHQNPQHRHWYVWCWWSSFTKKEKAPKSKQHEQWNNLHFASSIGNLIFWLLDSNTKYSRFSKKLDDCWQKCQLTSFTKINLSVKVIKGECFQTNRN